MKNWERFANCAEAEAAHADEKVIMRVGHAVLKWLYMDYIDGESRIDYLRRLSREGIMVQSGYDELKRLEKAKRTAIGIKQLPVESATSRQVERTA